MRKAAIVVAVGRTGQLTPLNSVASGARRVAKWLRAEDFDVKCLTDQKRPVEFSQVEKAVKAFVTNPPRYHLLLVYFSGHGYWHARSDVWLLSGAPVRADEAINLETAIDLAKYSGIPNVIFVSDACRSIPNTRAGASVAGRGLFPNYDDIAQASKIDCFKATSEALPAYEGNINGKSQSLLTAALISAYEEPKATMVLKVVQGGKTIEVVPNRRLEEYLQEKVDKLLAAIGPNQSQRIEVNVPSDDYVYLSRVRRPSRGVAAPSPIRGPVLSLPQPAAPDPGREAAAFITESLSTPATAPVTSGGAAGVGGRRTLAIHDATTEKKVRSRLPDRNPRLDHFETKMGFLVQGASVRRALAARSQPSLQAEVLQSGDGKGLPGIVRVNGPRGMPPRQTISVAVQLPDGRCVVLAGMPGYIGHVVFNAEGLSNVSYIPSSNHGRWKEYKRRRDEIDRLRAMVALAVDRNTFRLQSDAEANAFAERIRMLKGVDPTLGLYAAYAFSQAGNTKQLVSVLGYMREDLRADLFDVRLLASREPIAREATVPVVPFCPLLTQSWHLLNVRRITKTAAVLERVRPYLCGSLWTTFEPEGAELIMEAITKGALK